MFHDLQAERDDLGCQQEVDRILFVRLPNTLHRIEDGQHHLFISVKQSKPSTLKEEILISIMKLLSSRVA